MEANAGTNASQQLRRVQVTMSEYFDLPGKYSGVMAVGNGSFGYVCAAQDVAKGRQVAIKKLDAPFATAERAKRAYRELVILQRLDHENILKLRDVYTSEDNKELYLVTDLMDMDLYKVLHSPMAHIMTEAQCRAIIYQILRALKYLASAQIVHRDLKPSNVLVNANWEVQICDFGTARGLPVDVNTPGTPNVMTRPYRSPEILLTGNEYSYSADVWSAGCIFAELLTGKITFLSAHDSDVEVYALICDLLGSPTDEVLLSMQLNDVHLSYARSLPRRAPRSLNDINGPFRLVDDDARDLLSKMLRFDPHERISAAAALAHPYFSDLHNPDDEPEAMALVSWPHAMAEPALRTADFWHRHAMDAVHDRLP
jgi:p38 MAP kinase